MNQKRILIVGGVAGGASCAARARRLSETAEIIMFDRGEYVSFANCGLPYYVGNVIKKEENLLMATPEMFRKRFEIDVRLQSEVVAIDRENSRIQVKDLRTAETRYEPYDALVLAPGASPIRPPMPGIDLPGIFSLRTIPDSRQIKAWIDQRHAGHAVVVGGGYMSVIGCMAALWHRQITGKGQRVDVSMTDCIMPMLTLQLAQYWGRQENDEIMNPFDDSFPFYGVYECADGKSVSLGALEQKFWAGFCQMAGKPEWLGLQFPTGDEKRKVREEVARLFRSKSRDEWLKLAEVHDVCLSSIHEMEDLEKDPQLQARRMIIETEHENGLKLKGVGIPIKFSESKPNAPEPAPSVGQHSIEILKEIGYSHERIEELLGKGIVFAQMKL